MMTAMNMPLHNAGFEPPADRAPGNERRTVVLAELIATTALAVATVVVAAVVSMGIARASAVAAIATDDGSFAIAVFFGALLAGMGCLTALTLGGGRPQR